jgi:hypothetical protein
MASALRVQLVGLLLINVNNRAVKYVSTKFRLRDLPTLSFPQVSIEISIYRRGPSGALKRSFLVKREESLKF